MPSKKRSPRIFKEGRKRYYIKDGKKVYIKSKKSDANLVKKSKKKMGKEIKVSRRKKVVKKDLKKKLSKIVGKDNVNNYIPAPPTGGAVTLTPATIPAPKDTLAPYQQKIASLIEAQNNPALQPPIADAVTLKKDAERKVKEKKLEDEIKLVKGIKTIKELKDYISRNHPQVSLYVLLSSGGYRLNKTTQEPIFERKKEILRDRLLKFLRDGIPTNLDYVEPEDDVEIPEDFNDDTKNEGEMEPDGYGLIPVDNLVLFIYLLNKGLPNEDTLVDDEYKQDYFKTNLDSLREGNTLSVSQILNYINNYNKLVQIADKISSFQDETPDEHDFVDQIIGKKISNQRKKKWLEALVTQDSIYKKYYDKKQNTNPITEFIPSNDYGDYVEGEPSYVEQLAREEEKKEIEKEITDQTLNEINDEKATDDAIKQIAKEEKIKDEMLDEFRKNKYPKMNEEEKKEYDSMSREEQLEMVAFSEMWDSFEKAFTKEELKQILPIATTIEVKKLLIGNFFKREKDMLNLMDPETKDIYLKQPYTERFKNIKEFIRMGIDEYSKKYQTSGQVEELPEEELEELDGSENEGKQEIEEKSKEEDGSIKLKDAPFTATDTNPVGVPSPNVGQPPETPAIPIEESVPSFPPPKAKSYEDWKRYYLTKADLKLPEEKLQEDYQVYLSKFSPIVGQQQETSKPKLSFEEWQKEHAKEYFDLTEPMLKQIYNTYFHQSGEGKSKSPYQGLYDYQIDKMLKGYPGYLGAIASNEVSSLAKYMKPNHRYSFVMNLDSASKPGSHWVACMIDPKSSIEYNDSFGMDPTPAFRRQLKVLIEKLNPTFYLPFKINRIIDQRANSSDCGYFAVKFLMDRYAGKPFKDATGYSNVEHAEKNIKEFRKKMKKFTAI